MTYVIELILSIASLIYMVSTKDNSNIYIHYGGASWLML